MRNIRTAIALWIAGCVLALAPAALAAERFVVRSGADAALAQALCEEHGLRYLRPVVEGVYFLAESEGDLDLATLRARLSGDPRVQGIESDDASAQVRGGGASAADGIDRTPTDFFGSQAWAGYAGQPAVATIGADRTRDDGQTGAGVLVAVIDTGIDPDHPVLQDVLVQGYDFTCDLEGLANDWTDDCDGLVLQQGSNPILRQGSNPILRQGSNPILRQGSNPILRQGSNPILREDAPAAFGHGTLVAGLVHVVAPEASIMPLKAFRSDGSARTSDVLRAIYHAVESGADVINMSFTSDSREVRRAVAYAASRGVICLGAAGNDGLETVLYPAALRRVFGVAATNADDTRAEFSNYGERLVKIAAPGVELLTTYPGGRYASCTGTSFSNALAAGAAAVLKGLEPDLRFRGMYAAFDASSRWIDEKTGVGRIDVSEAARVLGHQ